MSTVDVDDCNSAACDVVNDSELGAVESELEESSSAEESCDTEVEGGSTGVVEEVAGMGRSMSSSFDVSLIEMTIFSRSTGVMCFSRPRLSQLSARLSSGRALGMVVAEAGVSVASESLNPSEDVESRLDDSSGTGMSLVAAFGIENRGACVDRACDSGLQQKVSRFHRRQLRFSSRLPSSIACDVLENNDHCARC